MGKLGVTCEIGSQPIVSHHDWPPGQPTPIYTSILQSLGLLIPDDGGSTHLTYNPEDSSEHHTRRRENLKSHNDYILKQGLLVYLCNGELTPI
jgi:hypothetical protein